MLATMVSGNAKGDDTRLCCMQGNLKGEWVVAILPSGMEASYCTSGFFVVVKPAKQFHSACVAILPWTLSRLARPGCQ